MRFDDGLDQSRKSFLDFVAPRGVSHFNTVAFAADETGLTQGFEVLRERGLGDAALVDPREIRAALSAIRPGDLRKDGDADRIGERVKDAFNTHVL